MTALNLLTLPHQDSIVTVQKSLVLMADSLAISIMNALIAKVQPLPAPSVPSEYKDPEPNTAGYTGLNNFNIYHHSDTEAD